MPCKPALSSFFLDVLSVYIFIIIEKKNRHHVCTYSSFLTYVVSISLPLLEKLAFFLDRFIILTLTFKGFVYFPFLFFSLLSSRIELEIVSLIYFLTWYFKDVLCYPSPSGNLAFEYHSYTFNCTPIGTLYLLPNRKTIKANHPYNWCLRDFFSYLLITE